MDRWLVLIPFSTKVIYIKSFEPWAGGKTGFHLSNTVYFVLAYDAKERPRNHLSRVLDCSFVSCLWPPVGQSSYRKGRKEVGYNKNHHSQHICKVNLWKSIMLKNYQSNPYLNSNILLPIQTFWSLRIDFSFHVI